MSTVVCSTIWGLFFLLASVSSQCCTSSLEYCPPQSVFSVASTPTSCTSFGSGHIHTFDGLSYDFHEYGDFWLINSANFAVQARQIECKTTATQSVPISSTTELQATCNKAYVILVNNVPYEIRHDINTDYVTVVINSVTQAPSLSYSVGSVTLNVRPIQYVNPYKTLWRDQQAYLNDADFGVTATVTGFGNPITINIWFYATGHSTIQVILPSGSSLGSGVLSGLCGYRDGCVANDLVLRANPTFNPNPDALQSALPIIEIVRTTNSGSGPNVSAGSLPVGNRFINKTDQPQQWASVFGNTWRVASSENRFQVITGDNYNIRAIKTSYSNGGNDCSWPSGWTIPQFIQSQCSLDKDSGSDPDGFDQLPAKHVLWSYCQYYCTNFVFPFRNPQLLAPSCNGICEFPQGDTTQDLHTAYTATNLPASFLGQNKPQALFTPQMNLGGEYSFRLKTSDYCSDRVWNITRTIKCNSGASVTSLPKDPTPSSYVPRNKWYGYPTIWVGVDSPSNFVRSSWAFEFWPNQNVTVAPTLLYTHSLTPSFIPNNPGLHVLEFAVYDGCAIRKLLVNITALCSSCVSASIIDVNPVKEVMWGLIFNSPNNTPTTASGSFPTKSLSAADQPQDWPQYAGALLHNWTLVNDDRSYDVLTETFLGSRVYNVNRYPNSTLAQFGTQWPQGQFLNISETQPWSNATPNIGLRNTVTLPALPPLTGPIGTQFGAIPPQREFTITREGFLTSQTNTTSRTRTTTSYWQRANSFIACVATIAGGATQSASVAFAPQGNTSDTFTDASRCVGQYNLNLSVAETLCNSSVDVQKIEVECGAVPDVMVACPRQVTYVYTRGGAPLFQPQGFPAVTIDASLSKDPYARTGLRYRYNVVTKPAGSTAPDANCNYPNGCTPNTYTLTPDLAGDYGVQVTLSNGCNTAVDTGYFHGTCPGSSTDITANFNFNGFTNGLFPYNGQALVVTTDSSSSTTVTQGASLQYSWRLTKSPAITYPLLPNSSLTTVSGFPFSTASLSMNVGGTYTIELTADQGCGQTAVVPKDFTLQCDAQIQPAFTPTGVNGVLTVNWNATIGGWNQVTLTPSSTFTFNQWPTAGTGPSLQAYFWLRNGILVSQSPNPIALPLPSSNVTELWVLYNGDGCTYATNPVTAQVTVIYNCFTGLQAVITQNASLTGIPALSAVQFFSNTSILSNATGTTYTWQFVSVPNTYPGVPPTFNTQAITWVPFWGGNYILQLTINDGCVSSSVNATLSVACTVPLPLQARALAPDGSLPPTFTWTRNSFGQVLVDSNATRPTIINGLTYEWRVLAAPMYSIYHPSTTFTSIISNVSTLNTTIITPDGVFTIIESNTTYTETNTSNMTYVTLINRNALSPQTAFPACFYPDLGGNYQLQLTVTDSCQTVTSVLNVPVNCASKPTPKLSVTEHALFDSSKEKSYVSSAGSNTWNVQLSRFAPRRILLDARQSQNFSLSQVTYYWAWATPDPRADSIGAQASIETPYASTSAVTLMGAGTYHMYLTVHDGCDVAYLNFTLAATCSESPDSLGPNVTVSTDGRNLNTFLLSMKQDDKQLTCAKANTWLFYNFTAASTSGATRFAALAAVPILVLSSLTLFLN